MKIAVIATVWFPLSHADVIVTRWVKPFATDYKCGWSAPRSKIASAYIEQRPHNDIGVSFCSENGIVLAETVAHALTLGTGRLAVDGVLLIGEHGVYPSNEFGQKLYPRKRLFDDIAEVFRACGKSVPVFNDKHFSWDFTESCEMLQTADRLGFSLYGGSSLPHCPTAPEVFVGKQALTAVVALFHGGAEAYGYHSMELAQALIEKRAGNETGIRRVRSLKDEAARNFILSGAIPHDLLLPALVNQGYPDDDEIIPFIMRRVEGTLILQLEHFDGIIVSHILLPKFVSNWAISIGLKSKQAPTCQVDAGRGGADFFQNFAFLNAKLERFFQTGVPPTSPLRTHLVTGALQASLHALKTEGEWLGTPHLAISY